MSDDAILRVAAVQWRAGAALPESPRRTWRAADILAFPEYFRCGPDVRTHEAAALEHDVEIHACARLSRALETVTLVAGTLVAPRDDGALENRAYVMEDGAIIGHYAKVHPMPGEVAHGIRPGTVYRVIVTRRGVRLGLLICSDVLVADSFARIAEEKPDVIVIPTSSPYRPHDTLEEKHARDRDIFVAGARTAGAYVVKVCTLGPLFDGHALQGRTLVAAPWGVMMRVPEGAEQSEAELVCDLDLPQLRRWRTRKKVVPRASRGAG